MSTWFSLILWSLLTTARLTEAAGDGRAAATPSLVVDEAPSHVRPYVLPKFAGRAVYLTPSQPIRFSITANATGGAFSMVQHTGKASGWTPARPHSHRLSHEYFYCARGRIQVWGQGSDAALDEQEARVGTVGDFAAMPPGAIHTFQLTAPDSQMTHIYSPGGFEHLFEVFSGGDYRSDVGAPYPPDWEDAEPFGPLTPEIDEQLRALDLYAAGEDVFYPRRDFVNGTAGSDESLKWHDGNNTLPDDPTDFYFIAKDYGPKYLNTSPKSSGYTVIQPLVTPQQNSEFTVGTLTLSPKPANGSAVAVTLPHPFALQMEEGQLALKISGFPLTEYLLSGDVAFIPANVSFEYHATVPFTRFLYLNAGDRGLDYHLMEESIPWGFPTYPIS